MNYGIALLIGLVFSLPAPLYAEQKFYQVIDPDGRVRTVKIPEPLPADADKAKPPPKAKAEVKEQGSVPGNAPIGSAPYDGDTYMDSDVLESSGFNPEKKQHFYIINDGLKSRVEENMEGIPAELVESGVAESGPTENKERRFSGLPDGSAQTSEPASLKRLLGSDILCLAPDALKNPRSLEQGKTDTFVVDKPALNYKGSLGVVGVYQFPVSGIKTMTLRSYALSDSTPAFVRPLIALADAAGCIQRVLTEYFQSRHEATKTKHPGLEGEIMIHADELYLFIIAPEDSTLAVSPSYPLSSYGQLSMKWQP